jgi:hypothetical protein
MTTDDWKVVALLFTCVAARYLITMTVGVWIPEWKYRRMKRLQQLPKAQLLKEKP